jgi:hypothetical protein
MSEFDPREPRSRRARAPQGLADLAEPSRSGSARRGRWLGAGLSVATHLAALFALIWAWVPPPPLAEPAPIEVNLVRVPKIAPPDPPALNSPRPPTPPKAPAKKPTKPRAVARRAPVESLPPRRVLVAHADVAPRHAAAAAPSTGDSDVSDAELAAADSAGSGGGGGDCNMAARLQEALRRDPLVQSAIAQARAAGASSKAIRVWNGDWIQSRGEDGKGLSAVREAITWEVAFAPKACRSAPVHGLVLLSPDPAPGSIRLAVGSGDWRWSDLLLLHPAMAGEMGSRR